MCTCTAGCKNLQESFRISMMNAPQKERRRWPRFNTQEGCLIFESRGAIGEVRDISAGGIGIFSIYELSPVATAPVDCVLCGPNLLVENLKFQVRNSSVLPKEYEFSTLVKRRYGLQLASLTEGQQQNLQNLIKTCQTD